VELGASIKCLLCGSSKDVTPQRFTAEAADLFKQRFGMNVEEVDAGGICARCNQLPIEERRALAHSAIATMSIDLLMDLGITRSEATRIVMSPEARRIWQRSA
jgi:hypothetical protein